MSDDIVIHAVIRDQDQYVWLYRVDRAEDMMREIGRQASDPDLSLTWYDAAHVCQKIRQTTRQAGKQAY